MNIKCMNIMYIIIVHINYNNTVISTEIAIINNNRYFLSSAVESSAVESGPFTVIYINKSDVGTTTIKPENLDLVNNKLVD